MTTIINCQKAFVIAVIFLIVSCNTVPDMGEDLGPRIHLIYVTSNSWHTAIVVPASPLISSGSIPEIEDFPEVAFFEFGWGDRTYYPAKTKTFGMTISAALLPTSAIIHIVALHTPPKANPKEEFEVISIKLTKMEIQRLIQALATEFDRPSDGDRAKPVSQGLYSDSYFYHAHGTFHLFNTCNTWTARMLQVAGVDISPSGIVSADGLMSRLRETLNNE